MRLPILKCLVLATLSCLFGAAAFAQTVEYSGSFDGTNGTRPDNWVIYGASDMAYWTLQDGALNTGDGDSYDPGMTWAALELGDSDTWSDYTVGVDVAMTQSIGVLALAARWRSSLDFYYVALEAAPGTPPRVRIAKMVGGRSVELASSAAATIPSFTGMKPGSLPVRLEFQVSGSRIIAYVNGLEVLSVQDSAFTSGTVALGQEFNQVYFSNLRVSSSFDPSGSIPIAFDAGGGAAGATSSAWRLLVLDKKPQTIAKGVASQLEGYPSVTVLEEGPGTFSVYIGQYESQAEATEAATSLLAEGYLLADTTPRSYTVSGTVTAQPPSVPVRATSTPAEIAQPAPEEPPRISPAVQRINELTEISNAARKAEAEGNLAGALELWYRVKSKADKGTPFWQNADERIIAINRQTPADGSIEFVQPLSSSTGMSPVVIGGVVTGVLIVLGGGLYYFISRSRKQDEELLKKVQALSGTRTPTHAATAGGATASQPSTLTLAKANPVQVGPEARIRPGTVSNVEETPRPPAAAPPNAEPTPQPPRTEPTPRPAPEPTPTAARPPKPITEESGVKLDFLFEDDDQEQPEDPRKEDTTEFAEPPTPDRHTPGEGVVSVAPAAPAAAAGNAFYAQDCEDEQVDAPPANWKGDYEYASLTVHGEGAGDGTKCLRFEKKQGIGSAYYSCRFPNASGRIGVEFDLRCDDKNKYLLGFYIERDEDFRQSIHTIVHRPNSTAKPTLRLQNEATPYEFGEWTHIKFEIDLPRHIVDGYVNDKPIAMGARLNNCPKYVNTLSIRDNLATTGSLLIDNIRIYRV